MADLEQSVEFIVSLSHKVSEEQWNRLYRCLAHRFETSRSETEVVYDANFSLADELQSQIMAVRAIRQRIMSSQGVISDDITTREAKEVISSGSTLLGSLMKYHEKVVNMERLRLLESAVIEALGEVQDDVKDKVLVKMEEKLAAIG